MCHVERVLTPCAGCTRRVDQRVGGCTSTRSRQEREHPEAWRMGNALTPHSIRRRSDLPNENQNSALEARSCRVGERGVMYESRTAPKRSRRKRGVGAIWRARKVCDTSSVAFHARYESFLTQRDTESSYGSGTCEARSRQDLHKARLVHTSHDIHYIRNSCRVDAGRREAGIRDKCAESWQWPRNPDMSRRPPSSSANDR
ncbi:hypothetical protein EXIGLDRAFT_109353 [Exidia glandulosa HHB12029]|uniref:Uncharacterized protein n=1 Tax=Exidia glandulosa HHB12029 TaxID=1314781 RepID=A0A165GQB6_EXIGL|nr:hypothetical protein EXIGLDRAFT_109353 [Exidia glandulosa HHB12029]